MGSDIYRADARAEEPERADRTALHIILAFSFRGCFVVVAAALSWSPAGWKLGAGEGPLTLTLHPGWQFTCLSGETR